MWQPCHRRSTADDEGCLSRSRSGRPITNGRREYNFAGCFHTFIYTGWAGSNIGLWSNGGAAPAPVILPAFMG